MTMIMYNEVQKLINEDQYIVIKNSVLNDIARFENNDYICDIVREIPFETDIMSQNDMYQPATKSEQFFSLKMYQYQADKVYIVKRTFDNDLVKEIKEPVTQAQVKRILKNDIEWLNKSGQPLLMELYIQMKYNTLKPVKIIEYSREICEMNSGNELIIFDSDIVIATNPVKDFFVLNLSLENKKTSLPATSNKSIMLSLIKMIKMPSILNATLVKGY